MRRLVLFRHAKSDWPKNLADHERPLAERGRAAAPAMGRYFAEEGLLPDLALVSSALRTRETWDLATAGWPETVAMRIEPRIYEAPPSRLLDLVRETSPRVRLLMLVGHNPGMADLALRLVGHGDRYALTRMRRKYPTAGIAVLDLPVEDWSEVEDGIARLDRFVTPKSLGHALEDE